MTSAQQSTAPASTSEASAAPTTTAAPTTEDPLLADQALVRTLFYGLSQSSMDGLQGFAEYMAGNNHPEFSYSVDECLTGIERSGATDNYRVDYVPDVASMAIDPGWALGATSGRYAGLVPSGRNYILPVAINESDLSFSNSTTAQMHASVLDGRAYFFFGCNETT
ncbi:hypothetical protein [Klenkia marina]|uniref:hypothetical protein n=1 Tax=Klenkia marina TaxID=1960309 RepID=UPI000AA47646|nr:hypothetical protein [Klenkia marina]